MAIGSLQDGLYKSIEEINSQQTRLRVTGSFSALPEGILYGVQYDYVKATYPSTIKEVYTFRNGGSLGLIVAVIEITYTTASKADIDFVERTT